MPAAPREPPSLCFHPGPALCLKQVQVKPLSCLGHLLSAGHMGVRVGVGRGRDSEAEWGRVTQKRATWERRCKNGRPSPGEGSAPVQVPWQEHLVLDQGLVGRDPGIHPREAGLSAAPEGAHHCHLHPALVLELADQGASGVTLKEARIADKSSGAQVYAAGGASSQTEAEVGEHRDRDGWMLGRGVGGCTGQAL